MVIVLKHSPRVAFSSLFSSSLYIPQDIDWDPVNGQFLVSVSSDQTTRLHAPWKDHGGQVSSRFCSAIVVTYNTIGSASFFKISVS